MWDGIFHRWDQQFSIVINSKQSPFLWQPCLKVDPHSDSLTVTSPTVLNSKKIVIMPNSQLTSLTHVIPFHDQYLANIVWLINPQYLLPYKESLIGVGGILPTSKKNSSFLF